MKIVHQMIGIEQMEKAKDKLTQLQDALSIVLTEYSQMKKKLGGKFEEGLPVDMSSDRLHFGFLFASPLIRKKGNEMSNIMPIGYDAELRNI